MNATLLYTSLSRQIFTADQQFSDSILKTFMSNDSEILRMRGLLVCRACRELPKEPFCSHFCQHLICKSCYQKGEGKNYGCKWCRNNEDLIRDNQSDIIIMLFKKLCAIMEDVITESIKRTGPSKIKEEFLKFLKQDFDFSKEIEVNLKDNKTNSSNSYALAPSDIGNTEADISDRLMDKFSARSVDSSSQTDCLPLTLCECLKKENSNCVTDLSNHPIAITPAESSTTRSEKLCPHEIRDPCTGDDVSSTVPDNEPNRAKLGPIKSKDDYENKNGMTCPRNESNLNNLDKQYTSIKDNNSNISPKNVFETISNISLKSERKNRSIFEKFGLALTPPPVQSNSESKYKRRKKKLHRDRTRENNEKEPKILPLKLKMRKINTENSDESGYLVQYNIEKIDDENILENNSQQSDDENRDYIGHNGKKFKRKTSYNSDYRVFSDDSDFEDIPYKRKTQKLNQDVCGCGAGNNVKYFTDICKRARCPCFSKGQPCVNCRCRFCSNPFILEEEEEEVYSESDSSNEIFINGKSKDECEMVDVENM